MSEKRFAVTQTTFGSGIYDYQAENELCESYDEDAYREVCKKLNELSEENEKLKEENEQLKSDNFNLNKSVECLDETVKEQCNKLDWADECDVRWEEGYTKWIGR